MALGFLSTVVLVIVVILAVAINVRMFRRFLDPHRKSNSQNYDENLHAHFKDKPRDNLGPLSIFTLLMFGLFLFLGSNGY